MNESTRALITSSNAGIQKHGAYAPSYLGYGWRDKSYDDERYHKAKELAEDTIEGYEYLNDALMEDIAQQHAKDYGNGNAEQQSREDGSKLDVHGYGAEIGQSSGKFLRHGLAESLALCFHLWCEGLLHVYRLAYHLEVQAGVVPLHNLPNGFRGPCV